jgi:transcriptional regulator with XRE-family HTH domain
MRKANSKSKRTQFFATTLAAIMERNKINQVQLSAATGIAVSRVNNYLHGKYRTVRPDHVALLVKAVGRTSQERGELARTYLEDLLPEELHVDIRIEVASGNGKPSKATAALAGLQALSIRSAKARKRMELFAEILAEVAAKE